MPESRFRCRVCATGALCDPIVRAHSDAEVDHLMQLGANSVIMGEREIARGMVDRLHQAEYETADETQEDRKTGKDVVVNYPRLEAESA